MDPAQVRVIWESPTFQDYNWTVRGDVDGAYGAGFKERLRAAIVAIKDPELLAQFARSRFIPAANADYAAIEEIGEKIGLLQLTATPRRCIRSSSFAMPPPATAMRRCSRTSTSSSGAASASPLWGGAARARPR